jgi:hypothetical protein
MQILAPHYQPTLILPICIGAIILGWFCQLGEAIGVLKSLEIEEHCEERP